jgi:hypothetical protein
MLAALKLPAEEARGYARDVAAGRSHRAGLPDALLDDVILREIAGAVWLPGDENYDASPQSAP